TTSISAAAAEISGGKPKPRRKDRRREGLFRMRISSLLSRSFDIRAIGGSSIPMPAKLLWALQASARTTTPKMPVKRIHSGPRAGAAAASSEEGTVTAATQNNNLERGTIMPVRKHRDTETQRHRGTQMKLHLRSSVPLCLCVSVFSPRYRDLLQHLLNDLG